MQKSLLMQEAQQEKRMQQRRPLPPVGRPTPLTNLPTMCHCPRSAGLFSCDCNSPECICQNGQCSCCGARCECPPITRANVNPNLRPGVIPTMCNCARSEGRFSCDCNTEDCVCQNGQCSCCGERCECPPTPRQIQPKRLIPAPENLIPVQAIEGRPGMYETNYPAYGNRQNQPGSIIKVDRPAKQWYPSSRPGPSREEPLDPRKPYMQPAKNFIS